jgi:hypothetical protein
LNVNVTDVRSKLDTATFVGGLNVTVVADTESDGCDPVVPWYALIVIGV